MAYSGLTHDALYDALLRQEPSTELEGGNVTINPTISSGPRRRPTDRPISIEGGERGGVAISSDAYRVDGTAHRATTRPTRRAVKPPLPYQEGLTQDELRTYIPLEGEQPRGDGDTKQPTNQSSEPTKDSAFQPAKAPAKAKKACTGQRGRKLVKEELPVIAVVPSDKVQLSLATQF